MSLIGATTPRLLLAGLASARIQRFHAWIHDVAAAHERQSVTRRARIGLRRSHESGGPDRFFARRYRSRSHNPTANTSRVIPKASAVLNPTILDMPDLP